MESRRFVFEWDPEKADENLRKHDVRFELACTVFNDPALITVADLEHGASEERWYSVGWAANGAMLTLVYLWSEIDVVTTKIRIISARKATQLEIDQYQEGA